ncbi:hypothetical protein MGYG_01340 [Nannizzia gypsea CBS 118893]|uniref:Zinc finger C2H2 LYAR-type domain-containing protein n=1 Tax=Arthroderma gypseum (strain ATCC MYA-4604 / CBS 118893) TaxID=535722 RepID=E5R0B1_ARTGP|nr:hypothetical protein MGYG_01340 [Nannizzia gypsea CBS 118893]EFQ98307.1 hypothetical protein MGYG_01340 [Nannizzia gypsea CBS 118893]
MVSFQCENCGDVLTKKKLDSHRGQCRGASFSCLDCMVHFQGTEYRSHTSCMTEAQKYQGALYKEKPAKNTKKKAVTIAEDAVVKSLNPYVEDAPDADDNFNGAPPPAPSPPPFKNTDTTVAKPRSEKIDVFDFLDESTTPNASRTNLNESMTMVEHAPPIFDSPKQLARIDGDRDEEDAGYDVAYEENGFSYGAGPIPPAPPYRHDSGLSTASNEFRTPAQKWEQERQQWLNDRNARINMNRPPPSLERHRTDSNMSLTSSDKKRKRGQAGPSDPNLTTPGGGGSYDYEADTPMMDASAAGHTAYHDRPPPILHSGLTGNLSRMMRYSASPDYTDEYRSDHSRGHGEPNSPIKRSKRTKEPVGSGENGLGISMKGQGRTAGKLISMLGAGATIDPATKALVRTKRRTSEGSSAAGAPASAPAPAPAPSSTSRELAQTKKTKRPKTRQLSEVGSSRRKVSGASTRNGNGNGNGAEDSDSERPEKDHQRKLKAIEYKRPTDSDDGASKRSKTDNSQMILFKNGAQPGHDSEFEETLRVEKASVFLSLVNKGPDSERGCSVHKILKRYHRLESPSRSGSPESKDKDGKESSRGSRRGRGRSRAEEKERKEEEEQQLWRTLRVKRNDNGEMVLFLP